MITGLASPPWSRSRWDSGEIPTIKYIATISLTLSECSESAKLTHHSFVYIFNDGLLRVLWCHICLLNIHRSLSNMGFMLWSNNQNVLLLYWWQVIYTCNQISTFCYLTRYRFLICLYFILFLQVIFDLLLNVLVVVFI